MDSEAHCEYCNCSNINCLAQCATTGLYFCNGKGETSKSHIIQHLQSIHCDTINLPRENRFSNVSLRCYICNSTNIFRLGFVFDKDGKIFIVCRSPCQFDESLTEKGVNNEGFQPLVVDNEILPEVVNVPEPNEYKKVPIAKIMAVKQQALDIIGKNDDRDQRLYIPKAKLKYDSIDDYVALMTDFSQAEHEAVLKQEENRNYGGIKFEWEDPRTVSFKAQPQLFRIASLGTSIVLATTDVKETAVVVKRNNNMHIVAKFSIDSLMFNQSNGISVSVLISDVPFKRQVSALKSLHDNRPPLHWLILDLFLGNTEKVKHHNRVKGQRLTEFHPENMSFPELNQYQVTAINVALNQRFTLIQGPPGTGKTTVIAALAYSFVRNGIKPVLVCAQSNVAADFATSKIAQIGLNVVRVLSSVRESIMSDVDLFTTRQKATQQFGEEFEKLIDSTDNDARWRAIDMERTVVQSSEVVCATCVSSGGARLKDIHFRAVIFDESGQCLDPDLLIALTHHAQQAVLVGDHRQLGPVVISREVAQARYDLPLMQRLVLNGIKPVVLRIQYRMHSAIASFPSATFYQNLLKNGVSDQERTWANEIRPNPIPWPNPNCPILFWNVFSKESNYESATSYVNHAEVGCIANILTTMAKNGVKACDIGIITPYAGQQSFLIESLPTLSKIDNKDEFFEDLEISSVDAFQGREKNFIIFSCVRANSSYDIGFLKDMHRLCVSLTRAKYGIITVGNASTFAKSPFWSKLIQHYIDQGAFMEGDDLDSLKPSTFTSLASPTDDIDDNFDNFDLENDQIY